MNLNKLGLVVASAGAIFMATSCKNNTVSLKKATEWVNKNFTHASTEETDLKEVKVTMNAAGTKGEDAIGNLNSLAVTLGIKNFNVETLKGDATYTKNNIPEEAYFLNYVKVYCSANDFVGEHSEESVKKKNTKFSIENNKLTESSSYDAKISGQYTEGKMKEKYVYNKEGARTYISMKVENGKAMSYPDSVVNVSFVVTAKY